MVDVPSLSALLDEYARDWPIPPSPLSPADIQQWESETRLVLPPDYVHLILALDVREVEIDGARFSPPLSKRQGVLAALRFAVDDPRSPLRDWYRSTSCVPVGDDWAENELVMSVEMRGQVDLPNLVTRAQPHPSGTVWTFDPENLIGDLHFVSSTLAQALHMALLIQHVRIELPPDKWTEEEVIAALETIDTAIRGHAYWPTWAGNRLYDN